jgi:serine phosphatase RsbU (regulator of sigma subunit)
MTMTKQLKLIVGFVLFAVMTLYWASASWLSLRELHHTSDCGLETKLQDNKVIIAGINLEDYSPILHPGDEILGIRGQGKDSAQTLLEGTVAGKAGSETVLLVKCHGAIYEVPVTTKSLPLSRWVREIVGTLTPWTFLLTGLLVFLLRHDEPQAWLLSVLLGSFIGLFNIGFNPQTTPQWFQAMDNLAHIFGIVFVPLFAVFFLVFPERDVWLTRWPKLLAWLFVPFLVFMLPINTLGHLSPYSDPLLNSLPRWFLQTLNWVLPVIAMGYLIVGLIALVRRYQFAAQSARRKLQLIVAGCSLGIFNILIVIALEITNGRTRWPETYDWLQLLTNFTLPLIPIAFAYAIIKHQVIPISLIVRRGMRYVLVSRGSVLLEIAAFTVILSVFLTFFFRWLFAAYRPKTLDALGMTIGIVSATVGIVAWNVTRRLHQKYLAPIIDRKFFRQSYDSHQIITGLAESLRSTTEQPQLLEEVATKLQSALQTEAVAILLKDHASGEYVSSYYCEYSLSDGCVVSCAHHARLAPSSEAMQLLSHSNQCREVRELPLPDDELYTLRQLKAELLLPLSGKEQMLGIIALGHRLGDLPFSREDEELLMSVANPVALAIENARLVERMIEEARRREEIEVENEARAKELEGARQLQLSMLPKKIPQLPNLEIAAYMKTATEVGGDYYDFHLNGNGALTVAVGDATGHGLKAGTVVTAIKSLFRTFAPGHDLVPLLSQSSRVLKEMNLRSLFMAMTVVRVEGYRLKISAAGMPPVLIYRALTGEVEEVFIKALPLGSVLNYAWRQEECTLDPNDIILLMSDGFPERFNDDSEMLGYAKAHEVLKTSASLSAQEVIAQLVAAGDHWAAGRAQDDDVTFVVLKVR